MEEKLEDKLIYAHAGTVNHHENGEMSVYNPQGGMPLREHYAGLAMQGIIGTETWLKGEESDYDPQQYALMALECADALIAELENGE